MFGLIKKMDETKFFWNIFKNGPEIARNQILESYGTEETFPIYRIENTKPRNLDGLSL
jgi:hypothetical protein